jgi:4-amino-4-deoxy-L-arabinose transferase-like glycosyltransferase
LSSGARRLRPAAGESHFTLWLTAIVVTAVVIRALHTFLVAPWPPGIFNDEAYYATLAQLIADGKGFIRPAEFFGEGLSLPTAERAPLFTLALAGLSKLGIEGGDLRVLGLLTGAVTVLVLGLLGRRLAGERAGLLAAALGALYPTLIAADGALMTESLYGALAGLSLLSALRLVDAPSTGRALVLGAVVGVAALSRAEALILLPLLLVPLVRRPGGLKLAALVCVAFAVVLAPWTVRNWSVFDRPVLVATEGGETLAGANCDGVYSGERIGAWSFNCVGFSGKGNEAAELNEEGRKGLRYALDHAQRLPLVLAARFGRSWGLWHPFAVPEGRRAWVMRIGAGLFYVLLALAVYGLILLRRAGAPTWIVITPFITVTVVSLLAYGSVRFRHSAELPLVVLAAVALDRLWARAAAARGGSGQAQGAPA